MSNDLGKIGEKKDYSDEILENQKIIRELINDLGWSDRKFAGEYCNENPDCRDEADYNACIEKVRKQISTARKSKKVLHDLNNYICFIENTDEFKKSGKIRLTSISLSLLDNEIKNQMIDISKTIDKLMQK